MIEVDDIVWRVDNRYLGPPGKTLPIPIRMNALWIGILTGLVLFIVAREVFHIGFSYNLMLIIGVGTFWFTTRFMRHVSAERPARAVLRAAFNDLRSPREPRQGHAVTLRYAPRFNARPMPVPADKE